MRFPIRPFEKVPHINFMAWRPFWIWSSVAAVVAVFALVFMMGMNWGIDFTGGKLVEVQTGQPTDIAHMREALEERGFTGVVIQQYGGERDYIIRLPLAENAQAADAEAEMLTALKAVDSATEIRRVEFVGPQVG